MNRIPLLAVCLLVAMASAASAQTARVFVTSEVHSPDLGGLAPYDAICNDRAGTAGLGGDWVAWMSTSTVDAKDRLLPSSGYLERGAPGKRCRPFGGGPFGGA